MLDAFEALGPHRRSIVVIGAHAIYMRQPDSTVALAPFTKDSDLAIDPRSLAQSPTIEDAMQQAGFSLDPEYGQPGLWFREDGTEVDLMVPEAFAGPSARNRRGARIPPHNRRATRRARGLEAALVDNNQLSVGALDPTDGRVMQVLVAGPAALLVSKLFKLAEREEDAPDRLEDKDAHDVFRILQGTELPDLQQRYLGLLESEVSREVANIAITYLKRLFADGPEAIGSLMAGRAETGIGTPLTISQQVTFLARELLEALGVRTEE